MKKSDLKNGMIVELRDGHKMLVVITEKYKTLISYKAKHDLDFFYDEDLNFRRITDNHKAPNGDIVKIYNIEDSHFLVCLIEGDFDTLKNHCERIRPLKEEDKIGRFYNPLIWEREEETKTTETT